MLLWNPRTMEGGGSRGEGSWGRATVNTPTCLGSDGSRQALRLDYLIRSHPRCTGFQQEAKKLDWPLQMTASTSYFPDNLPPHLCSIGKWEMHVQWARPLP